MKMMKLWMLVAVAAMASACSKQDIEGFEGATAAKTIEFVATDAGGRTIFGEPDGDNYPVLWQEGDQIKINVNHEFKSATTRTCLQHEGASPRVTIADEGASAVFTVEMNDYTAESYTFYSVSPAKYWLHSNEKQENPTNLRVEIPTDQSATATSCDPLGQLLFAQSATTNTLPEKINLHYNHLAAYGCITLNNVDGDISNVNIVSSENISGRFNYDIESKTISFSSSGFAQNISVGTSSNTVWFAAIPTDLSNTTLTINVTTTSGLFKKEIALPANRELKAGQIAKFSVDFSGISASSGFKIGDIYPATGTPEGVVFWVADDGNSAKILGLKNMPQSVWMELPDGMEKYPNISGLSGSKKTGIEYTNAIRESVKNNGYVVPMITFLDALGADWYWPMPNELGEMRANMTPLNTILGNIAEGEALKSAAYWASQESGVSTTTGESTAYYYNLSSGGSANKAKSSKYYGRAVKVVTKE